MCALPGAAAADWWLSTDSTAAGLRRECLDWRQQGADKKIVAGLLGVLAGGFGIHKFILGYTTEGIIQIVVTFCHLLAWAASLG